MWPCKNLDKWQVNKQNNVNFTVERAVFCFFWFFWLVYGVKLCHLGFGEDTDAWLMAQTAQKLSFGEGYDPARSFGNPVYEFLLVLIQPHQNWFLSNLFNLFLASLFLWRLGKYFPGLSEIQLLTVRLTLLVLPIFTEAATCSMEYMLVWFLLMEALLAEKNGQIWLFWCLVFLAVFTRFEFLLFFIPIIFYKNEKAISPLPFYFLLFIVASFIFWSFGKNPAPFSSVEGSIYFYGGRLFFLFKQAGVLSAIYLGLLAGIIFNLKEKNGYQKVGIVALVFFVLFPFEWAYSFPAMIFGLVILVSKSNKPSHLALPFFVLMLTFIKIQTGSILNYPSNFRNREEMTRMYNVAQIIDYQQATLVLEGATFLPTDTRNWEKGLNNRLFHRKNSNFFVAEKLTLQELDSLKKVGMVVLKSLPMP